MQSRMKDKLPNKGLYFSGKVVPQAKELSLQSCGLIVTLSCTSQSSYHQESRLQKCILSLCVNYTFMKS